MDGFVGDALQTKSESSVVGLEKLTGLTREHGICEARIFRKHEHPIGQPKLNLPEDDCPELNQSGAHKEIEDPVNRIRLPRSDVDEVIQNRVDSEYDREYKGSSRVPPEQSDESQQPDQMNERQTSELHTLR